MCVPSYGDHFNIEKQNTLSCCFEVEVALNKFANVPTFPQGIVPNYINVT